MYPYIDRQSKLWMPVCCTLALAMAPVLGGCGSGEKTQRPVSDETPLTVRIDRADNGAAAVSAASRAVAAQSPRTFTFEMTGIGKAGRGDASSEDRAAAGQAAIIEAFCNALMEAQGKKPGSVPFEADFGPRLKVARTTSSDGVRTTVTLVSHGIETRFVSAEGKLQHQPHDLRLVQQVFDATNGEFSLLASSWSPGTGQSVATVARYLPARLDSALAGGNTAGKNADGMAPTAATP
jgi:hypothetical protein